MTIGEFKVYEVSCDRDGCGAVFGHRINRYSPEDAERDALAGGWSKQGDGHTCTSHERAGTPHAGGGGATAGIEPTTTSTGN